jgi:ketosteroid isomerase-like protein
VEAAHSTNAPSTHDGARSSRATAGRATGFPTPSLERPRTSGDMRRFAVTALLCLIAAKPALGQSAADKIRALRAQSNAAIARHDVTGVVALLDVEYQITAGDGTLSQDRSAEPEIWAKEFARAADLVYVRTPSSIAVSASGDRAAEAGTWTGSMSTPAGPRKVIGRYAAYWRSVDGHWKIRSELFVALSCEGRGC